MECCHGSEYSHLCRGDLSGVSFSSLTTNKVIPDPNTHFIKLKIAIFLN